jgi:hypothetical protein
LIETASSPEPQTDSRRQEAVTAEPEAQQSQGGGEPLVAGVGITDRPTPVPSGDEASAAQTLVPIPARIEMNNEASRRRLARPLLIDSGTHVPRGLSAVPPGRCSFEIILQRHILTCGLKVQTQISQPLPNALRFVSFVFFPKLPPELRIIIWKTIMETKIIIRARMNPEPDNRVLFDTVFSHCPGIMLVNHETLSVATELGIGPKDVASVPLSGHPIRRIAFIPKYTIVYYQFRGKDILSPDAWQSMIQEAKDALVTEPGETDSRGRLCYHNIAWNDEDEDEEYERLYYPRSDLFVDVGEEWDRNFFFDRNPDDESQTQLAKFMEAAIGISLGPFDCSLADSRFLARTLERWARKNARALLEFLVVSFGLNDYTSKDRPKVIYIVVDDEILEGEEHLYEIIGGFAYRKAGEQGLADVANMPTGPTARRLRYSPDILRIFFRELRRAVDNIGRLWKPLDEEWGPYEAFWVIKWDKFNQDDEEFIDEPNTGSEGAAIEVDEGNSGPGINSRDGVGVESEVDGESRTIIEAGMLPEIRIVYTLPFRSSTRAPVVVEEANEEEVGAAEESPDVGAGVERVSEAE